MLSCGDLISSSSTGSFNKETLEILASPNSSDKYLNKADRSGNNSTQIYAHIQHRLPPLLHRLSSRCSIWKENKNLSPTKISPHLSITRNVFLPMLIAARSSHPGCSFSFAYVYEWIAITEQALLQANFQDTRREDQRRAHKCQHISVPLVFAKRIYQQLRAPDAYEYLLAPSRFIIDKLIASANGPHLLLDTMQNAANSTLRRLLQISDFSESKRKPHLAFSQTSPPRKIVHESPGKEAFVYSNGGKERQP